jgi:hypothetical protein
MQPDPHALVHEHSVSCWWDLEEARWSCPPPVRALVVPVQGLPVEEPLGVRGSLVGAGSDLP